MLPLREVNATHLNYHRVVRLALPREPVKDGT